MGQHWNEESEWNEGRGLYILFPTVFNSHFSGKPGLASCPLESQSPVILILSDLMYRPKLHTLLFEVGRSGCILSEQATAFHSLPSTWYHPQVYLTLSGSIVSSKRTEEMEWIEQDTGAGGTFLPNVISPSKNLTNTILAAIILWHDSNVSSCTQIYAFTPKYFLSPNNSHDLPKKLSVSEWLRKVLHPAWHTIGHFGDESGNHLYWYGKTNNQTHKTNQTH